MNIEILRIHEDYVTTIVFTLTLLNGLLVLVEPKFSKPMREMPKEELNVFFWRDFTRLRAGKMAHCQFIKGRQ